MADRREHRRSWLEDAVAGAIAGAAASWAMEQAQARWITSAGSEATRAREREAQGDLPSATVLTAERAAHLAGRELPDERKEAAGEVVHYATGAAFGALFGVVAPRLPGPWLLLGVVYGALVWIVNDEGVVPALGLSNEPWDYPLSTHAKALASHVVYGAATGAGLRAMEAVR